MRAAPGGGESDSVGLDLQDLLPDSGGEVVIHSTGLGIIGVSTGQAVTATGVSEAHVTVAREDVAGFRYYQLDGGVTPYCPAETSLHVVPETG